MSRQRLNSKYLDILKDFRDEEEAYSNRWMNYNRAIRSLQDERREYLDVKDLKAVKYIGDTIIEKIRKNLENNGAPKPVSPSKRNRSNSSTSDAEPSRGRKRVQKKSSIDDDSSRSDLGFRDPYANQRDVDLSAFPSSLVFDIPNILQGQNLPHPRPHDQSFGFFFVDSDHRSVTHHGSAEVDIHANVCWYKIRFLKISSGHPLAGLLRLIPNPSGVRGVVEAWIQDEHVVQFGLYNAPGFSEPSNQPAPATNGANNFHGMPRGLGSLDGSSLSDLLNNEKKSKGRTLDPTRSHSTNTEWQVSAPTKPNIVPKDRFDSLGANNGTAQSRAVRMTMTSDAASLSTPPPTQAIQQSPRSFAPERPVIQAKNTKAKGKRPIRGRTSEFIPAPLPTDEFDLELEKQSNSQLATSSHATADLIDDITDLTNPHTRFSEFEPIVFQPGSFEITLILDNREVKSQKDRDFVYNALKKRQINVEQRSLVLGDVLWVAKCHLRAGAMVNHECVLDYILERKRLDDLCQSIKDGRFHEQKFRLGNTGLKVFYLVEQYDTQQHEEIFGVQIDTARSSTQVVDGFILKETSGLNASIDYLATMHKTLVEMYHNKPLHIIPPNLVKRHSYLALQKHLKRTTPDGPYLTSYDCFERLNSKTANLTARDIFAQMLLCIKGVSAEKAAAIINNFPTMRSLWEAFEAAENIEDGDRNSKKPPKASEMLCRLEGKGRKHFGPALSTSIYNLFRK